jgi:hypothetical protein
VYRALPVRSMQLFHSESFLEGREGRGTQVKSERNDGVERQEVNYCTDSSGVHGYPLQDGMCLLEGP